MKHTVVYGSAFTDDYLIVAIKKSQRAPFLGRHDCRLTCLWPVKHTEINGCALTGNCRLHISVWNQHRPRPFSCSSVILTQRICFRFGVQRAVWMWNIDFGNWKMSCFVGCSLKEYRNKGLKERLWEKCARAKMEMLGIMRKAKHMVFQPQYAQCFTAKTTLPQTYDYNIQYSK